MEICQRGTQCGAVEVLGPGFFLLGFSWTLGSCRRRGCARRRGGGGRRGDVLFDVHAEILHRVVVARVAHQPALPVAVQVERTVAVAVLGQQRRRGRVVEQLCGRDQEPDHGAACRVRGARLAGDVECRARVHAVGGDDEVEGLAPRVFFHPVLVRACTCTRTCGDFHASSLNIILDDFPPELQLHLLTWPAALSSRQFLQRGLEIDAVGKEIRRAVFGLEVGPVCRTQLRERRAVDERLAQSLR